MSVNMHLNTITVKLALSDYGDALIFGLNERDDYVPGLTLKQRLFAWHEASFYGTELAVRQVEDVQVVVLPAEQVIPFFSDSQLLSHVHWNWEGGAARLNVLAPLLTDCLKGKKYIPRLSAYREGRLQWTWEDAALQRAATDRNESSTLQQMLTESSEFTEGLRAAFSAVVSQQYYGTEATAGDLRSEYPLLFDRSGTGTAGMDEAAWLISIGWKADTAPFRPALQLLEPEGDEPHWILKLVLQDKYDESVLVPIQLSGEGEAAGKWPAAWTSHVTERAAGWSARLLASLPGEQLLSGADMLGAPLSNELAWRFLTADSRRLLEAGWQVLLPAWWETASRKKPRLRAKVSSGEGERSGQSLFGLDSLIDFDWRISIGDADLSESEFAELVARGERLVRFRGQWIPLDPALLAQIQRAMAGMDKSQGLSFQDVLQLHLLGTGDEAENAEAAEEQLQEEATRLRLEVELNGHLLGLIGQLGQQAQWPKPEVPVGLRAELRSYQHDGFAWLAFLRRFGLGACLADDMGLGKTVQLITYLLHLKDNYAAAPKPDAAAKRDPHAAPADWPSLIICPTSVLGNWQKELARFAPSLNVMLHYGSKRLEAGYFYGAASQADVVLTSYATASLDQELLKQFTWGCICLDEAQNIKNAQTKQSVAVRSFPALHRIALTGTPIENRLSELWSIYDFITPGYLGSSKSFQDRFSNAIEKERDERRTNELQRLVKPFMLRRKKKDPAIQLDLPDKNEMKTYIHLTAEQAALYDQTVNELLDRVQKLEGIERKGAILSALTRLKQLCDHPALLSKEALQEMDPDSGAMAPLNAPALIGRSAKLERLMAMVRELREEGERCLIFTQYVGMGQMLQAVLQQELGEPVLYLNGSTSKTARDRMIDRFQAPARTDSSESASDQPNVFILSLKAGGVGLNLTAANHVFHFDRWWNPAVENQATDRAYRMGQTRDVQVHKFISLGTLEERIDEMLESKQQLSDNVISSSEGWITELSTDALKDLFTLRREWMA
ncbi:helicase [Bacillus sp. FJAT-27264]|uniref:DEAD/DEAH box helicase n=1 Tax=Paenibacillus sp. (strain DSM 101736 / FJAT-27264) TaxID=1850362 RepID=UPI000807F9BB|nr:DEAD/DEAH box helicase [Bacillus sp. FJAT-27264]OBZ10683.1 helicase [Bacillus sp. FJAT-27264]